MNKIIKGVTVKLQLNARRVLSIHFAGFDDRIRAHARLNSK